MELQNPNPFQPPTPKPGEVPNPVRDVPPHQPTDPVFPPVHDPAVDPDRPTPEPNGPSGP